MKLYQNKIIAKFGGVDKVLHFAFGGWISCLGLSHWYYVLLIGLLIGIIKETYDKYVRKQPFDYWDIIATFSGSIVTAIVSLIL